MIRTDLPAELLFAWLFEFDQASDQWLMSHSRWIVLRSLRCLITLWLHGECSRKRRSSSRWSVVIVFAVVIHPCSKRESRDLCIVHICIGDGSSVLFGYFGENYQRQKSMKWRPFNELMNGKTDNNYTLS